VTGRRTKPRLFISYRIADSTYVTGAVADRLAAHFGKDNVFRDRDSLSLGSLYPRKIRRALEQSDFVLAMLGPSWLDIRNSTGQRRLDDPRDWVRTELHMAFERGIPVAPVLLDHTPLPEPAQLPAEIASLSLSTYWRIRRDTFESDVRGLIAGIEDVTGSAPASAQPQPMGTSTQHNHASGGGQIIANQNGDQTVNGIDFGRNSR
jgi:hypothetical protein